MIRRALKPESNFTTLSNSILGDRGLSWAARGLLVFLLSKPDHWQVSTSNLVNETANSGAPLGRDGVRGLLAQLIAAGYMRRVGQLRDETGQIGQQDYEVSEQRTQDAAPGPAKPAPASPGPANPPQVKTEKNQGLKKDQALKKKKQDAGALDDVAFDVEAGNFIGLTPKQIDQWTEAYPKVNVSLEIERAGCWLICNPAKKLKQGEGLRFINGWISRSGGGQQLQTAAAIKPQAQQQSTRASRAEAFSAGLYSTPSTRASRSEAFMAGLMSTTTDQFSTAASRTEPADVIDVDAIEIP